MASQKHGPAYWILRLLCWSGRHDYRRIGYEHPDWQENPPIRYTRCETCGRQP